MGSVESQQVVWQETWAGVDYAFPLPVEHERSSRRNLYSWRLAKAAGAIGMTAQHPGVSCCTREDPEHVGRATVASVPPKANPAERHKSEIAIRTRAVGRKPS